MTKSLILAVDDEPIFLEVLGGLLADDYELITATDGPKALEAARDRQPALILLDIDMPGMDGYAVCRSLKDDRATAHIPVIFVTAYGQADAAELGVMSGAVDYIVKPFAPETLHKTIRANLPPAGA